MSELVLPARVTPCLSCGLQFEQERKAGRPRRYCDGCFGKPGISKTCSKCRATKRASEFYLDRSTGDGLRAYCKSCDRQNAETWRKENRRAKLDQQRRWSANNRDRLRAYDLKRNYGITQEEYDDLLTDQQSRCAICATPDPGGKGRFHVDHDHETDIVRGLLCHSCNTGLGLFADDPDRLRSALVYLDGSAP